jgi:hypothetical protein
MTDWMTSVPDTPGDMDDELSGVSPELVLIDPDLAQKLRERSFDPKEPRAASAPVLRLVRARSVEASETPGLPARVEHVPSPAETPSSPRVSAPAPTEAPAAVPRPATPVTPSTVPVAQPRRPAPANLAERLAGATAPALRPEAETPVSPAPPAESVPLPVIEAHPVVDQQTGIEPPPLELPSGETVAPEQVAYAVTPAVMPHPVARPTAARVTRAARRSRGRGRRLLGFLAAVAVASVAVLGITNFTGGSVPGLADGDGPTGAAPKQKPTAKPKPKAATKPTAANTARNAGAASKQATKRPTRPPVAQKPKPKPKQTAAASSPPKAAARKPAQPKPAKATSTPPRATKPAATRPAATKPAAVAEPRRFAWAPVDGAVAYHVELFRGSDRVFARDTSEPVLELGPTWRHEGKTVALTPGTYRWYVWPVTKSGRATQAVVQAKLTVP